MHLCLLRICYLVSSLDIFTISFDAEAGWHDSEKCWVGINLDNNNPVYLVPLQGVIDEGFIHERMNLLPSRGELIIALKDNPGIELGLKRAVKLETEKSLLGKLINAADYKNDIKRRVQFDRISGLRLTLYDVYVAPSFSIANQEIYYQNIDDYLIGWLSEPGQRQIALLGEYGQGKSTTALLLTYKLLTEQLLSVDRIPILIELRGTSPRNLTPLQFFGAWGAKYNINPQALMRLHLAGRLLLIFEGFDEMALVGDAEMRLKHFKTLWQFCHPLAKIIITGRPNFFLDEEEMIEGLGLVKPIGETPYCEAIRLKPFGMQQIERALRGCPETVRAQICNIAAKNAGFLDLISRPSLLQIVSSLWEKENLLAKAEQLNSAYVMDLFVRASYRRQGLKESDSKTPDFMALTTPEREYFMMGIASAMVAAQLPNQISIAQLNLVIEGLIKAIPDSVSLDTTAMSTEAKKPLRSRLDGAAARMQQEHVKTDVRTCGLLVDDPAFPGTFRFGHKSFMEFLFAKVIAEHLQHKLSERSATILMATKATVNHLNYVPVSTSFLAEMLASSYKYEHKPSDPYALAFELLALCFEKKIMRRNSLLGKIFSFSIKYTLWGQIAMEAASRGRAIAGPKWHPFSQLAYLNADLFMNFIPALKELDVLDVSRIRIWVSLCEKLEISDEIMQKLIGTWQYTEGLEELSLTRILSNLAKRVVPTNPTDNFHSMQL